MPTTEGIWALEDDLLDDPDDEREWAVYADWLQACGDARGELWAIERELRNNSARDRDLNERRATILAGNILAWLGPRLLEAAERGSLFRGRMRREIDGLQRGLLPWSRLRRITRLYEGTTRSLILVPTGGFVTEAFVQMGAPHAALVLEALLRCSSARLLRELRLSPGLSLDLLERLLCSVTRPRLRHLELGVPLGSDASSIAALFPRLRTLSVGFGTLSSADLPELETLSLALSPVTATDFRVPRLRSLHVEFGLERDELRPFHRLMTCQLPALRELRLAFRNQHPIHLLDEVLASPNLVHLRRIELRGDHTLELLDRWRSSCTRELAHVELVAGGDEPPWTWPRAQTSTRIHPHLFR